MEMLESTVSITHLKEIVYFYTNVFHFKCLFCEYCLLQNMYEVL